MHHNHRPALVAFVGLASVALLVVACFQLQAKEDDEMDLLSKPAMVDVGHDVENENEEQFLAQEQVLMSKRLADMGSGDKDLSEEETARSIINTLKSRIAKLTRHREHDLAMAEHERHQESLLDMKADDDDKVIAQLRERASVLQQKTAFARLQASQDSAALHTYAESGELPAWAISKFDKDHVREDTGGEEADDEDSYITNNNNNMQKQAAAASKKQGAAAPGMKLASSTFELAATAGDSNDDDDIVQDQRQQKQMAVEDAQQAKSETVLNRRLRALRTAEDRLMQRTRILSAKLLADHNAAVAATDTSTLAQLD